MHPSFSQPTNQTSYIPVRKIILLIFLQVSKGWSATCEQIYSGPSVPTLVLSAFYSGPNDSGHFERGLISGNGKLTIQYAQSKDPDLKDNTHQLEIRTDILFGQQKALDSFDTKIASEEHRITAMAYGLSLLQSAHAGRISGVSIKMAINGQLKTVGSLSVVDGSDYTKINPGLTSSYRPEMPAEILLKMRKTSLGAFDQYRSDGILIFESIKYLIDETLPPQTYRAVRKAIWNWFYRTYLVDGALPAQNAIFFFDVFSDQRMIATKKTFSANEFPPGVFTPSLAPPNYILATDIKTMRQRVNDIVNSP